MPRSSILEPEVLVLVEQAARVKAAVEAMADMVHQRQSVSAYVNTCTQDGRRGRCSHQAFDCSGPTGSGNATEGWRSTEEGAADALIAAVKADFERAQTAIPGGCLIWRRLPEIRSITSEAGDLFNGYLRLTVVPVDWIVEFPEDNETAFDRAVAERAKPSDGNAGVTILASGKGFDLSSLRSPITVDEAERPE